MRKKTKTEASDSTYQQAVHFLATCNIFLSEKHNLNIIRLRSSRSGFKSLKCTVVFCYCFERKPLELLRGPDFLSVNSPVYEFPLPRSTCALATWVLLKSQHMHGNIKALETDTFWFAFYTTPLLTVRP